MALTTSPDAATSSHWLATQRLLRAASTMEAPVFRALRRHETGWTRLSFWGVRFAERTLRELEADSAFQAARRVGEVAELVSAPSGSPAAPWIAALSEPVGRPLYLPPPVAAVVVPLAAGGFARYSLETVLYPLSSAVPRAVAAA